MHEIKAIVRSDRLADVIQSLHEVDELPGVTVSMVRGFGRREPHRPGEPVAFGEVEMAKLETVVPEHLLARVVDVIATVARTRRAGDGKIFVTRVEEAIRIRTGEREDAAL